MTVTETIVEGGPGLGSWELALGEETPKQVLDALGFFGHVAIIRGEVDVDAYGDALLSAARYVGVLRARGKGNTRRIAGDGMVVWLGDEDDKGHVIEVEVDLVNATLAAAVAAVRPPSVALGTVHPQADPGARYTGKHIFQSPRAALTTIVAAFGAEFRVNGNGTLDVGTAAQLYQGVPRTDGLPAPIIRRTPGADIDLVALEGNLDVEEAVNDYSTDVVIVGQKIAAGDAPAETFAIGRKTAATIDYVDLFGNPVKRTRIISSSQDTAGSVEANATLQLNRFNRVVRSLRMSADEYESEGTFKVGDTAYVYDPETGIENRATEAYFNGERIWPDKVRVAGLTWPVTEGHTVAFRTGAGVWIDLTRYVTWETGGGEVVVGDLPRSLIQRGDSPLQVRVDAARGDASIPNPPTGLTVTTMSGLSALGRTVSILRPSWTAPTANTDGTTLADLSHYLVQYRWTARAPNWQQVLVAGDTTTDITVPADLPHDVRVAAVDVAGHMSAWTSAVTITSAKDAVAPTAPADPVLTNIMGQLLKVEYAGTDAAGNPMATDTNRVDVEVGTSASGPWVVESSLNPFVDGIHHVTTPAPASRWVRLRAYDHDGNPSSPSAAVSGATAKVGAADIASLSVAQLTAGIMSADVIIAGRFATALTGARVETNALGFQKFAADNSLLVSITGTEALLTGIYKTAQTGRRIEIGAGGDSGTIDFYAPDGTKSQIRAWTEGGGVEAIQFGIPVAGLNNTLWNRINYNSSAAGEYATYRSGTHEFLFDTTAPNTAGRFVVFSTTNRSAGTSVIRLQLNGTENLHRSAAHTFHDMTRQRLAIDTGFAYWDAAGKNRVWIDPDEFKIYDPGGAMILQHDWGTMADLRWQINPAVQAGGGLGTWGAFHIENNRQVAGSSPWLVLYTPAGFGNLFKVFNDNRGTWTEVRSWNDTAFQGIRASNFEVNSDGRTKTDVVDATDLDGLALVRSMRVREYDWVERAQAAEMKGRSIEATGRFVPRRRELGIVAQEAPPVIVNGDQSTGMGIDVVRTLMVVIRGLQQLADRVDDTITPGGIAA